MSRWIRQSSDANGRRLMLLGSWRMPQLNDILSEIKASGLKPEARASIDGSQLADLDTAGAMIIFRYLLADPADENSFRLTGFDEKRMNLLNLVQANFRPGTRLKKKSDLGLVGKIGAATINLGEVLADLVKFIGETAAEVSTVVLHPKLFRLKEFFVQLELTGVDAIPIVSLVTFLIGIVIAYLFGIQIEKYGANILIVNAVSIAMCRELSPILVAILVAGRSGSAFTAQIGTMKLNEEIDAMVTLGLSPLKVLVLPRIVALMLVMPLLVFVGDIAGIAGSMVIAELRLGVTATTFIERLHAVLPIKSFVVGFVKAPVFALFIATIGCLLGLKVENNARSVGLNTTATVVRSIVAVILLNAAFAVIFVELGI